MGKRPTAIITGASGGMGRACARQLGATMDLVLTDASAGLEGFSRELQLEGFTLQAVVPGDFRSDEVIGALGREASGGFAALVHACGLPPSAPWRDILEVNQIASVRLLDAVAAGVRPGTAAVLIASVAGYLAPCLPEVDAVSADPCAADFLDRMEAIMTRELGAAATRGMGTLAYAISKQKVMALAEARSAEWGAHGGRIVSISPGMIYTPMGRNEANLDEAAEAQVKSTPVGRWGTAAEIASAACYLLSPAAAFITGTDLRVDGGAVGALNALDAPPWIASLKERMA